MMSRQTEQEIRCLLEGLPKILLQNPFEPASPKFPFYTKAAAKVLRLYDAAKQYGKLFGDKQDILDRRLQETAIRLIAADVAQKETCDALAGSKFNVITPPILEELAEVLRKRPVKRSALRKNPVELMAERYCEQVESLRQQARLANTPLAQLRLSR